jgi:hypothetical protein
MRLDLVELQGLIGVGRALADHPWPPKLAAGQQQVDVLAQAGGKWRVAVQTTVAPSRT